MLAFPILDQIQSLQSGNDVGLGNRRHRTQILKEKLLKNKKKNVEKKNQKWKISKKKWQKIE